MAKINRLTIILSSLIVGPSLGQTSLEIALSKAFNKLVESGTYATIFSDIVDIRSTSFCTGKADDWETPPLEVGETSGSDLAKVLDRGEFICGYVANTFYQQSLSAGQILLDTIDPDNVEGALVDWWAELGKELGRMYSKDSFPVKWNASLASSQEVLTAVHDGGIDAACARWAPDGFWNDADGKKMPRSVAFSAQICSTYAQTGHIYTLADNTVESFDALVAGINDNSIKTVCAQGTSGGGTSQTCSSQLSQYTDNPMTCNGVPGNDGFRKLDSGECDAVWEGVPEFPSQYNRFDQPSLYTPVTFFRKKDLDNDDPTSGTVPTLPTVTWAWMSLVAVLLL